MTNDVTTTSNDENLPSYLQQFDGPAGDNSNFDSDDIVLPQIKLLQGTSDQIQDFDDAKPGTFWFTGLDELIGEEVDFIVVSRKKKFLLSAPMDDGQGILARSDDAKTWDRTGSWEVKVDKKTKVTWEISDLDVEKSGLTAWGTYDPTDEKSPPAATLFYEYVVILPDFPQYGPMVASFARSAVKHAKKMLNSKIALHAGNGRPMQAIRFKMRADTEQNDAGQDFFVPKFYGGGFATEEQFNLARKLEGELSDYKVDGEGEDDTGRPGKVEDNGEY